MKTQKKSIQNLIGSNTFKLMIIGVLSLTLLIPISFVKDLIKERKKRKEIIIEEVNRDWGENVNIQGPILKIPYKIYSTTITYDKETNERKLEKNFLQYKYIYLFPENLKMNIDLNVVPKRRGIYKTSVYKAKNKIYGNFKLPLFKEFNINQEDIDWNKASIVFNTTNNKGIEDRMMFDYNQKSYEFFLEEAHQTTKPVQTFYRNDNDFDYYITEFSRFETKNLSSYPFDEKGNLNFSMNYNVRGSKRYTVIPVGNTTEVKIHSNWPSPDFTGEFLPGNDDKILPKNQGFNAQWKIIDYQRPFKKIYKDEVPKFDEYAFGVNLLVTVDDYLKTERSAKYAYLVIFLTFLVFFIIQNSGNIPMHSFHYLLIGLALVIFYTLLISISEHINYNVSYFISAIATVLLITLYSKAILKSKKFTYYVFAVLSLLYLYIYIIIQLENYALLAGSIGLFGILAFIMYSSRKIDW